jgi:hypothetical protein
MTDEMEDMTLALQALLDIREDVRRIANAVAEDDEEEEEDE